MFATHISSTQHCTSYTSESFDYIRHLGFNSTLMRILLSFQRLRRLDIPINTVISNKNVTDELCQNLENCGNLEEFNVYVSAEMNMLFDNVFISLTKL
jgi:hypothetical protein